MMMIHGLGPGHDAGRCPSCQRGDTDRATVALERARAAGITGLRDLWTAGA